MPKYMVSVLTPLVFLFHAEIVLADASEREAILAVMDKAFAAVRSSRPDDWRAIQLPEGTTLSFRPHPDGVPDKLEMRISNNEKFVADLEPDGHEYVERWTEEPTVLNTNFGLMGNFHTAVLTQLI